MFDKNLLIYFCVTFFFTYSSVWAENFWYLFEDETVHKKVFTPELKKNPQASKPAVLLIRKKDDSFDDAIQVLHYLRRNSSMFSCPVVPQPVISYSLFGKIPQQQQKVFEPWDMRKRFVSWDNSKKDEVKDLYDTYFFKLNFLKSTVLRLDKILTEWEEKVLPVDYLAFRDLKRDVESAKLFYGDFFKRLFKLMDKLKIPLDDYPQLYSYNELVVKNYSNPNYPQEQVSNEKDMFHGELTKKSMEISNSEINFLLETVVENQISMASFKYFMELMKKLEIDFMKNYPAYYNSLYHKAWYHNLRSEQTQAEISSCMKAVYEKVKIDADYMLIEKWADYKNALLNLLKGKINYDEYQLLKLRLRVYKEGAAEEHEKQVFREIRAVWSDTIQDQLHEVLRDFHNYVISYEYMFNEYKSILNENKTDIVMVLTDYYDLPAMFFWFSSMNTGAIIELTEPVKEKEPDNNYFKLMRGDRSPFEKLLEGIGED